MVNTFIIAKYSQYRSRFIRQSASMLDTPRLGKQRVEAMQILNNLFAIRAISSFFNIPIPFIDSDDTLSQHINTCRKLYTQFSQDYDIQMSIDEYGNIINLYNNCLISGNIGYDASGTKHTFDSVPISIPSKPYHTIKKLGYANHTCTYMWWGYENALKYYINVHIDEWVARGYKNTMHIYKLKHNFIVPSWCKNDNVINMFACALLYKERVRDETPHYSNIDWITKLYHSIDFIQEIEHNFTYYIWPSVFTDSWIDEINKYNI